MDNSEDPLLPQSRGPPPRDRFNFVYCIFYFLGLGSLIGWNFFITASEYFKYKLRNTTLDDDSYLKPEHATELQTMFEGYLSVASTVPLLFFNFVTALLIRRVSSKIRMMTSLTMIILMFFLTVSLVKVNTDQWQNKFFWITMVTAILINGGSSILCTSIFGLASLFPSKYMQAAMTGQAMGGLFAAIANLVTLSIGSQVVGSGLGFFICATIISICTMLAYCSLYCIAYSRYHILEIGETMKVIVPSLSEHNSDISDETHYVTSSHGCSYYSNILKKIWKEGLSVGMVFLVTLACYPAISSSIISLGDTDEKWSEKYFTALVCFLLFNAGDWSGRLAVGAIQWPRNTNSSTLLLLTVLRVVFIPLIMLCNVQPRHDPVIFNNDVYPVIFIMLLGLTNGYLGTLCMMYGPRKVQANEAETTGAIMGTCMTVGLVTGSVLGILLLKTL